MSRLPRVLLVIPSRTSYDIFLADVAHTWRDMGGEIGVACGASLHDHGTMVAANDVPVFPIANARSIHPQALLQASRALSRHVTRWRPAIIHAHFSSGIMTAAVARVISRHPGTWLGTFHGMQALRRGTVRERLIGFAEGWAARRMTECAVLNREDLPVLRAAVGSRRAALVPGFGVGCDLARFDPDRFTRPARIAWRSRHGISATAQVMCFVGRRTDFKGYAHVVRSFLGLAESRANLWLVVMGDADPVHPTGLTPAEMTAVADHPRAVLLGWQDDVAAVLQAVDLLVFPSVREGMPVNIMEALAMGVPVVTCDTRGCRDVVRDGEDGVLVQDRDPTYLVPAVASLLDDAGHRASLARRAREGRARFDRRRFVDFQLAAYERYSSVSPRCDSFGWVSAATDLNQPTGL